LGPNSEAALDAAFAALTDAAVGEPAELTVHGRKIMVPLTAKGVARFTFSELCENPLGAADYLAIAKTYHTIILSGIPLLPPEKRNEARRLVTLIDAFYEHRVNVVASAAAEPDELSPRGDTSFIFERTSSRLIAMRSKEYIQESHGVVNI
jgi:cell division protein ZapE